MVDALGTAAISGNTKAIEMIFDRIDGILGPILEGPTIDLETLARLAKEKRDRLRPPDLAGSDQ